MAYLKKEVPVNAHGEVADFVNVSQFEFGETQFACGPFAVALCKGMGPPGKGPVWTAEQMDQWADAEYVKLGGKNDPSDTRGVSIDDMHKAMTDAGLHWEDLPGISPTSEQASDIAAIKAALSQGCPVIATVTEASVFDLDIGGNPYFWGPAGTHLLVYSGIAPDGNLLARDPANVVGTLEGPNTVRPGPRRYAIDRIANQWAAIITPEWKGEDSMTIDLSNPTVANYFQASGNNWQCKKNGNMVQGAILAFYKQFGNAADCGLTYAGLPETNEMDYTTFRQFIGDTTPPKPNIPATVRFQKYERVWFCYDPSHSYDNPPGSGDVYLPHLPAQIADPNIQSQLATLQGELDTIKKVVNG